MDQNCQNELQLEIQGEIECYCNVFHDDPALANQMQRYLEGFVIAAVDGLKPGHFQTYFHQSTSTQIHSNTFQYFQINYKTKKHSFR